MDDVPYFVSGIPRLEKSQILVHSTILRQVVAGPPLLLDLEESESLSTSSGSRRISQKFLEVSGGGSGSSRSRRIQIEGNPVKVSSPVW